MALYFWKRRRRITLYSRPGCHLCEDARTLLTRLGRRYPLELNEVDIRSDPALIRRYDIRIPVIIIDGGRELEAPLLSTEVEAAVAGN
jgi:glutaredoxin